jgi:hypothetical protein
MKILRTLFMLAIVVLTNTAVASDLPDFTGTWLLNTDKGENLGMVAAVNETLVIAQTAEAMVVDSTSSFLFQTRERQVNYDLAGEPKINHSAMGDRSETVSSWADNKLVTTWSSEGAIADTKVVKTETRELSADGKEMTIHLQRPNKSTMITVYEKQ